MKPKARIVLLLFAALFFASSLPIAAQDDLNPREMRLRVETLFEQSNLVEALPWLEKLLKAEPDNSDLHRMLGEALMAKAVHVETEEESKALRKRARESFIKARDLGDTSEYVRIFIGSIPPDGGGRSKYSSIPASDAATLAGEQAFTSGKIDEALGHYKRAHELDANNYYAPLFAGNMYLQKNDYKNAEVWFQKAIAIDPFIETAYRYSATPLMRQNKFDQARDRYIEAWITEPYSRFAINGMLMWADATRHNLSHPRIEPPKTEKGEDGKPKTTINLDLMNDDGSLAWIAYTATGEVWEKEKFKKTFPNEAKYRRSLAEEADRLRSVVSMAKSLKPKKLNPQIEMIEKLDKDGVLEAFILMSYSNADIHRDHRAYLAANRDKMRLYVTKYVIKK
jgi:tetratricopeptide (TPR) repeat protein